MDNFKKVFIVRFLGYFLFISGIAGAVFLFGPIVQAEFNYRMDLLLGIKHTIPNVVTSKNIEQAQGLSNPDQTTNSSEVADFSQVTPSSNSIVPVSTDFGIVIEKINANAQIIADVDPSDEKSYTKALAEGVAEALGSTAPGQPGNLYLFSHSTDAPWNIVRYNAIFYLLRELDTGDRVIIFYNNRRYDYIVYDKTIVSANDVSYLTNRYNEPVLTLQTCDPPGTLFHRLIVRAKLVKPA